MSPSRRTVPRVPADIITVCFTNIPNGIVANPAVGNCPEQIASCHARRFRALKHEGTRVHLARSDSDRIDEGRFSKDRSNSESRKAVCRPGPGSNYCVTATARCKFPVTG